MSTTTTKPRAKAKVADVQSKAKAVYEKGAGAVGELKGFTKGNIDAVVESGKILGTGIKQIGAGYVAETRSAAATFNADLKEFAAIKSPVDFFKLQSRILGRNIGRAVDFHSKNAEAVFKLAKDSAEPITRRVGVAVDAVRKAA